MITPAMSAAHISYPLSHIQFPFFILQVILSDMLIIEDVKEQLISGRDLMTFRGHSHGDLEELLICLEGITAVRMNGGKTIYLTPGWGILLEAGPEHMIWDGSREKNTCYYNAYYKGKTRLFGELINCPFEAIKLNIEPFWNNFTRTPDRKEESLYKILGLLLALEEYLSHKGLITPEPVKAQSAGENIREQLRMIMSGDYTKNHRLTDLGQEFNLEPKYLSAKVKKITSLPVMSLYYQVKMEEAEKLLFNGNSVKETAFLLGFANPYHFSRKFKEIKGISPSQISPLKTNLT